LQPAALKRLIKGASENESETTASESAGLVPLIIEQPSIATAKMVSSHGGSPPELSLSERADRLVAQLAEKLDRPTFLELCELLTDCGGLNCVRIAIRDFVGAAI
jgi:hypothetical protein